MKRFIKSAIACAAAVAMIAAVAPVTAYAATKTATVSTQSDLNWAIENGAAKIIIKTTKSAKFTIHASKKAAKADFVVNAPNAKVANRMGENGFCYAGRSCFLLAGGCALLPRAEIFGCQRGGKCVQ